LPAKVIYRHHLLAKFLFHKNPVFRIFSSMMPLDGADIDPGDVNAAKYLDAVRQRMARQAAPGGGAVTQGDACGPPAEGPSASHRLAAPSNGHGSLPAGADGSQLVLDTLSSV